MSKRKYNRWKYYMLSATMLLAFAVTGCSAKEEAVTEEVIQQVTVSNSNPLVEDQFSKVVYDDVLKRDLYDSVVTPYVEELFFVEDGIFLEYCVAIGDEVTEGQVIARTDTTALQEQVEQLQEKIDSMKSNYEYQLATLQNQEQILEYEKEINFIYLADMTYPSTEYTNTCVAIGRQTKSIAQIQLQIKHLTEEYELELPYYEKKLKEAKAKLNSNVITAPFDGVILQLRSAIGGDRISAEIPYVVVGDVSRYMVLGTYVNSSTIEKSERIYVFINGREYEAEYIPLDSKIYGEILAKGRTAYSTYEIKTEETLEFGQTAVIVVVKESRDNVLTVPGIAVQREFSKSYVYVKRGEEREKVFIEVGLYDGLKYEVLSGLEEGDEVVLE